MFFKTKLIIHKIFFQNPDFFLSKKLLQSKEREQNVVRGESFLSFSAIFRSGKRDKTPYRNSHSPIFSTNIPKEEFCLLFPFSVTKVIRLHSRLISNTLVLHFCKANDQSIHFNPSKAQNRLMSPSRQRNHFAYHSFFTF